MKKSRSKSSTGGSSGESSSSSGSSSSDRSSAVESLLSFSLSSPSLQEQLHDLEDIKDWMEEQKHSRDCLGSWPASFHDEIATKVSDIALAPLLSSPSTPPTWPVEFEQKGSSTPRRSSVHGRTRSMEWTVLEPIEDELWIRGFNGLSEQCRRPGKFFLAQERVEFHGILYPHRMNQQSTRHFQQVVRQMKELFV
jgi:hypothetical protein